MATMQTRRRFLTTVSLAGAAGLLRTPPSLAAEGPLETTTVRLAKRGLCNSPEYVAEELLRAEGFAEIRYIDTPGAATAEAVAQTRWISAWVMPRISSPQSTPVNRSSCWPAFTSAASNCSRGKASAASPTSKAKTSA